MTFMVNIELYDLVQEGECWEKTGNTLDSTRWVNLNKGTDEEPEIRCSVSREGWEGSRGPLRRNAFTGVL
jgi:hypothetical protein